MEIIGLIETLESRINSFGSLPFSTALLLSLGLTLFFISNLSFQRVALDNLAAARTELIARKDSVEHILLLERYSTEQIPYRRMGTYVLHISVDSILIAIIFLGVK